MAPAPVLPRLRRRLNFSEDDRGVSEIMGKVIMVAMTVTLLGGFGSLVLATVSNDTPTPPAASFTLQPQNGASTLDVRLVSGATLTLADTTIVLTVDGAHDAATFAVVSPATAGEWAQGETLRLTLASGPLAGDDDIVFFAADRASGQAIGAAYATVPTPTSGAAILQNALGATLTFDRSPLVTDGTTEVNATVQVTSTHGLMLVDHVSINLTRAGGAAELRLFDDGIAPDLVAADGIFSASFSVDNHTFDRLPGFENLSIPAEVVDVLGKVSSTTGTLFLASPTPSKTGAGVVYRNIGSSGIVSTSGFINLSAFAFRDTSALDTDQVELRVSDLTDSTKVWSALVSFANTGCASPSITSIVLRRDGVAGNVTYTPSGGCFPVDADAKVNLANVAVSLNADGVTATWNAVGTEATYQYAAAGIGASNEALLAFFGDTVSASPFARGLSQTDFGWAPPGSSAPTVPSAISGLAATPGNGFVDLSWSAPATGGAAITNYRIFVDGVQIAEIGTNTTFRVNSLTNGQSYDFTVRAVNSVGQAPASNVATATPVSVPSAPLSLAAVKGNGTVALSWSAPSSNGGSAITNYHIYAGTTSGAATFLGSTGGTNTSFVVNSLTNGQAYFFNVTAQTAVGQGTTSSEVTATPSTIPNPPATFAATAGDGQVTLSWTLGSNGGSALTSHRIYRGLASGVTTLFATVTGANTSFLDLTTINGVTYYYNVTALNANGVSASTPEASATPSSATTVPSAPQSLSGTPANNSLALGWSAPSSNGGSAITNYKIYLSTTSGATVFLASTGGANTTFTANGLTNGQQYFFNVTAVNAVGESASSAESSATPRGIPYPPSNLAGTHGDQTASLTWSAPANTGGVPITNYHVYRGTSSGATTFLGSTGGSNTSFVVNSLTNGQQYFFNVTAVNAAGQSAGSNEIAVTPSTVPSAPTSLVATRGDTTVSLSWSAGATGGSAITNYHIYRGTSSGATTFLGSTGGSNTTFVVNGLTNGVTYFFNVTAQNANGQGATSAEVSATPATTPSAPQSLVGTKGNTTVSLSWSAPASSGGSPVTNYHIYRGTSSGSATFLASTGGTNTSFVVNSLTNGQQYFFNVTASNAVGQGASSSEASATPSTVPNPPTALGATLGNGTASLSWTAPASNGGSAITNYHIYRGTSSGAATFLGSTGGSNTSFVANGLTNGQQYFFNVTAENANGRSASSNEASVTPATVPNPPSSLTVTNLVANQLNLSWSAGSTGGSAITSYQIWRGTSSGGETLLATIGTNTSYLDLTVSGGTTYYYQIRAVNAIGTSSPSNEASATAAVGASPPSAPTGLTATPSNNQIALNWTTPSSNGGAAISAYKIYRGTSSGGETLLATIGTNLSFLDRTALNNVTYYYTVRAVNSAGDGTMSSEVSATPSSSIDVDCTSMVVTTGTIDSCDALKFGGALANIVETGGGGTREGNITFTMNVTGVSGTQTLEMRGQRNNAPEDLLLQVLDPSTGAYVTVITMPSTTTAQTTFSASIAMSTYASNGLLTVRIKDAGPDSNNSSWIVDFVRLVTT